MRARVEHLDVALGIGDATPRLSWQLPEGATVQDAYELRAGAVATGRVASADNVLVPWPWAPLTSRERLEVQVRVWTDLGDTPWSEPTAVEAGLLQPDDWTATWVSPVEHGSAAPGFRPAYLLHGLAVLDKPVVSARLYVTAHGIYEAYLNGHRVGDLELTPGYTEYGKRLQLQTYDVTDLVVEGGNAVRAVLADGWYRGEVGMMRSFDQWGDRTALLAQLHADHPDGTVTVRGTGIGWTSTRSHITAADLIEGQAEDHRILADEGPWVPVVLVEHGYEHLVASASPPVRAVQDIRPVAVTTVAGGRQVFDLGQNINGRVRLTDLGPAGTELTLTHGEALAADGDVTMDHLVPDVPFLQHEVRAGGPRRVGGRRRRRVRAAVHNARIPLRAGRGPPARADRRRPQRRRRTHRPAAGRHLRVQRRTGQRAARGRRVELPRQRVRRPHGLPDAGACGLDGGLAAVRADRDLPVRRGRLLGQVAARPRGRPVGRRRRRQHGADAGRRAHRLPREAQRFRGLGRRRGPRPVGDLPGVRRPAAARGAVAVDRGVAGLRGTDRRRRAAPLPRGRAAGSRPARAFSVGRGLPLGRVARAG